MMTKNQEHILSLLRTCSNETREILALLEAKEVGFDMRVAELYEQREKAIEEFVLARTQLPVLKQTDSEFREAYLQEEQEFLQLDTKARQLLDQAVSDTQEKLRAIYRGKHLNAYLAG